MKRTSSVGDGGDTENITAVPFTEATAKSLAQRPDSASEFARLGDLRRLFGLSRATAYNLAQRGLIHTISLRQKGKARGCRLVSLPSVRAYLASLPAGDGLKGGAA